MQHNSDLCLHYRSLWISIGYLMVVTVVYLSLTSSPIKLTLSLSYEDKIFHTLAYFILMAWFSQIYHDWQQRIILIIGLVTMGVMLEYVQSMNPNRFYEFADMVANTVGVILGFILTRGQYRFLLMRFERILS